MQITPLCPWRMRSTTLRIGSRCTANLFRETTSNTRRLGSTQVRSGTMSETGKRKPEGRMEMQIKHSESRTLQSRQCTRRKPPLELTEWLLEQVGIMAAAFGQPVTAER